MICIEDQGDGIADADKLRASNSLVQADKDAAKRSSTGLGLAICREIMRACHGRIWVEAVPGGGASFRLALSASASLANDQPGLQQHSTN